jgi:putative glutamine amidotransferase
MKRPIIGLTADWEFPGGYAKYPWYALRENYCGAIFECGGAPFIFPHHEDCIDVYLDCVDGIVVTGGDFDVPPALYGETPQHESVKPKENRSAFEYALLKAALARGYPILGICGGHQLLNVALGGTLIQHIPDAIEDALAHQQPNPRHEAGHSITVHEGTMLYDIVGAPSIAVNSAHHQAIKAVAPSLRVNAVASDGVIEGVEDPNRRFCMGVQWHPEFFITEADRRVLGALIAAARQ